MTLVVGVDGSLSCLDAVRVAVLIAAREKSALRGKTVRLVHAFAWPPPAMPFGQVMHGAEGELRQAARTTLVQAAAMARQTDSWVPLERRLITGDPATVLIAQAAAAEMIVLGDRGLGGFSELPLGSVAVQVAAHSPVPVLIAKGNLAAEGPVVVGVDSAAGSGRTMAWALREARARRAVLRPETADEVLVRLCETAQLLVISPASRHLLQYVHCPVLIVSDSHR